MSHDTTASSPAPTKHFVVPTRILVGVWISLMFLTFVTVKVSYYDFGSLNIGIAMFVATIKASLVVMFFMALRWDEKFNQVLFLSTLIFLGIFVVLTMADTAERGRIDPLEGGEIELNPSAPAHPEAGHADDGHGEADATGEAEKTDGGDGH